ncbi:MAG: Gfo/Idh/MocA family oxidoreductase [Clostridia bacterium]|nr:Gfo/Idh/MocA family oxidoreductase [Clostridia bacterium]
MSNKLRIGVVGCGGILEWAHFPAYMKMDNVELVAFCDILTERAEKFSKKYFEAGKTDKKPAVFENFSDLIKMEGIDAVDICTPNYLHSIVAVEALENGLHVFCEKPDAVSVSEAERMKAASEASGKVLMIMRNQRYDNSTRYLKDRIAEGKMGEIYAARCGWQRRRGGPPHGSWFSKKEESGGGPLIDLGVHMIDRTMWLMGNPKPVSVSGCTYNVFGDNGSGSGLLPEGTKSTFSVEDLAMAFVRFENGACLQVEVSWASNVKTDDIFFELRGTKEGAVQNQNTKGRLTVVSADGDFNPDLSAYSEAQGHEGNIRHFADVVLNGAEPMFVPQQGINMVKILEAIYKSAETGKEIFL